MEEVGDGALLVRSITIRRRRDRVQNSLRVCQHADNGLLARHKFDEDSKTVDVSFASGEGELRYSVDFAEEPLVRVIRCGFRRPVNWMTSSSVYTDRDGHIGRLSHNTCST